MLNDGVSWPTDLANAAQFYLEKIKQKSRRRYGAEGGTV
jgi:hypothetical protein